MISDYVRIKLPRDEVISCCNACENHSSYGVYTQLQEKSIC